MQKVGWWVVASLLALGALALCVWALFIRDKKVASSAMADAIDAWTTPRIKAATQRADALATEFGRDHLRAVEAGKDVIAIRTELEAKYQKLELTPEEMEQRFRSLRV